MSEPALLTRTSSPPSAFAASSTTRFASPCLVRSPLTRWQVPPLGADRLRHGLGLRGALVVVERERRARRGERLRRGRADPRARPGDQNALSGEIVEHLRFPPQDARSRGLSPGSARQATAGQGRDQARKKARRRRGDGREAARPGGGEQPRRLAGVQPLLRVPARHAGDRLPISASISTASASQQRRPGRPMSASVGIGRASASMGPRSERLRAGSGQGRWKVGRHGERLCARSA